jgi:hypothetical protein
VANLGPVPVGIYASKYLQSYTTGILNDTSCASSLLPNHAVLVIGYGIWNGVEYWLVKNSWGSDWGEGGYFRVIRNSNMCNIGYGSFYPLILEHHIIRSLFFKR